MTRLLKGRQRVYLVTPPADWRPSSLWDVPPTFATGQLVAKNLRTVEAAGYARCHNKQRLEASQQRGEPIGTWAMYVRNLRPRWHNRFQGAKGGAA